MPWVEYYSIYGTTNDEMDSIMGSSLLAIRLLVLESFIPEKDQLSKEPRIVNKIRHRIYDSMYLGAVYVLRCVRARRTFLGLQ
jgi:hypothetical protein